MNKRVLEIQIGERKFRVQVALYPGNQLDIKIESPSQQQRDLQLWKQIALALSEQLGISQVSLIDDIATEFNPSGKLFVTTIGYRLGTSAVAIALSLKYSRPSPSRLKIYFDHVPTDLEIAVALHRKAALLEIFLAQPFLLI
jgi:hypothetical protein